MASGEPSAVSLRKVPGCSWGRLSRPVDAGAMCDDNNTSTLDGGQDDSPVRDERGRRGRRRALFAGRGRLLETLGPEFAEAAAGTCTMTPAKTVGPYFVEEKLNRSDVRTNTSDGAVQAGVPLTLRLQVFDADHDCAPVQGRDRRHLARQRDRPLLRRRGQRTWARTGCAATRRPTPTGSSSSRRSGPAGTPAAPSTSSMVRTMLGARQLKLTLKASETVTVGAELTRGGKTVASKKVTLHAGTRA